MARGIKKIKKWTTISFVLSKVRFSGIFLMCQTDKERMHTQSMISRYGSEGRYRPYGNYIISFQENWTTTKLQLRHNYTVEKSSKLVLDTPSKHYARGKVVFKNEDSDA